jgi:hypothetical protein
MDTAPRARALCVALTLLGSTTALARRDDEPPRTKVMQRRAIVAVAEHADHPFEGWTGPGLSSTDDLLHRLRHASDHWRFLSRGRETLDWTLVRIALPEPVAADSYDGDLAVFRGVVAALVREAVDEHVFDANRDGLLDLLFVVVANHGVYYPWLGAGPRPDNGAWQWVETQDSWTWTRDTLGAINHELAAALGVHGLFGPFDTVGPLSLMAVRWARPAADFTAVERAHLGWLQPRTLKPGTHTVRLVGDGEDVGSFDAVRIETARPEEFFLVEFHRRRSHGYGSSGSPPDGLVVHHVLRGSTQSFDPPYHKVEPADGRIPTGGVGPDGSDLLTPENAATVLPLVVRSYAEDVAAFRIDDVAADGADAMRMTVTVFAPPPRANLLHEGGFERGTPTSAVGWQTDAWTPTSSFFRDRWRPLQGRFAASIKSRVGNDARWVQTVDGLDEGAPYLLCGALRGRAVGRGPGIEVGGNLSVLGLGWFDRSEDILFGDFGWRRVCFAFRAPSTSATVACRLGFYSSLATGQLWCDDLSLERLEPTFAGP